MCKSFTVAITLLLALVVTWGVAQLLLPASQDADATLEILRNAEGAEGLLVRDMDHQVEQLEALTLRMREVVQGLHSQGGAP